MTTLWDQVRPNRRHNIGRTKKLSPTGPLHLEGRSVGFTKPDQLLKSQNGTEKYPPAFDAALLYSLHSDCTPVAWGLTELERLRSAG
jgi:hypothetical protein